MPIKTIKDIRQKFIEDGKKRRIFDKYENSIQVAKVTIKEGKLKAAYVIIPSKINILGGKKLVIMPGNITFHLNGNFKSFRVDVKAIFQNVSEIYNLEICNLQRYKTAPAYTNRNYTKIEIDCGNAIIKMSYSKADRTYNYSVLY